MATRRRQTAVFGQGRALEPVVGVMVLVISLCMASTSRESHAASRDAERPPARLMVAQADQRDFDIPAQPLGQALTQFGIQTNYRVLYNADVTEGRSTGGVSGRYSAEEALSHLLEGTGVTYTKTNPNEITLRTMEPSGAAGAIVPGAAAGAAAANGPKDEEPLEVREVVVKSAKPRETAELNNLPPEYPGGQVARGGRVGMLGNRDIMDTPLTQMNYTSKLIQDQQARFLTNVLRNDPSVQLTQSASVGFQQFNIRGFSISPDATSFNGFMGVAPGYMGTMMTESIERVEVLRGPSALLNGAPPGGAVTGGMVNLVPKRAGDEALTRLTAQYMSDSQVGGHVDLGRRFGSHKQFGVRVNGAYRNGDLPINHSSRESALVSVGLDYRGDVVRLSADFGYQEQDVRGARRQRFVVMTALPEPSDTRTNPNQPWEFNHNRALYGTLRGEVDVTKQITAFAGFGISHERRQQVLTERQLIDSQGTLAAGTAFFGLSAFTQQVLTFDAGLRSAFDTGPIHHQAVVAYTQLAREFRSAFGSPVAFPASNLYNPVFGPAPPSSSQPGYGDTRKSFENNLSSAVLGDTLSILDGRVQLTAGVRFQQIKGTNFNIATGAVTGSYDKSAATPMVGLVVKPWQQVSLYANYIEGLQQGPTAPLTAANAGEVFPPFVSKGYEAGVKVDFGRLATTLAVYQITQPSAFINPATNVFGVDGEQRNRGVEFNVFGEVMEGLRLLGGTSYIDAELTRTQGGVNQGNTAIGALPFQLTLYGEWDLPFLKALTLTSRVTHASSEYLDLANTQKIPDWTQWDLGARYRFERENGKAITIRAFLENALDTNAWAGSFAGTVLARNPRTLLLSATFDF